ncbi:hypothetical protein C1S82_21425 [Mycolicibacterium cosmeticum]|uniref:Keratin associated protein n=1 Tax=Mycolicibacterium cosmeticum TaxID=258533 RepID=W9BJL8_MYCCO|nr:hypothetical protein [Mycolicibacterium cosmeticum]TLH70989.1 hypothetical protein C1S82_21425 [Mycolicibacterium cosmeticum]CDO07110.1 hypothetical protein BN977_01909 [Mycolicibacterium cosmeticum]
MRIHLMPALLAAPLAALVAAPVAAAAPECVQIGPNTTQCTSGGHTQIVTSPPANNNGPFYGWPYGGGGIIIGLG